MLILALLFSAPHITYEVKMRGERLVVDMHLSADAWGKKAESLCVAMDGAGIAIVGLKAQPGDPDCFGPFAKTAQHVHYEVMLEKLARGHADPDYALRDPQGEAWLTNDQAILLRPDTYAGDTHVEVTFPLGDSIARSFDADQLEGGAYALLTAPNLRKELVPIVFGETRVQITRFRPSIGAPDAVLRAWVEKGARALHDFHGKLPTPMHVIVVPVADTNKSGVFGTVLRQADASAVLFFGAKATEKEFASDWVSVHELFHAGMPHVKNRPAWFIEGFTTYYQDILRARNGMLSVEDALADLEEGNREYCQPVNGRSLRQESAELRLRHSYQRVYWGGACLAYVLDITLRQNGKSLDAVLSAMYERSLQTPLTEEEVIAWLDREVGAQKASRFLDEKKAIDLRPSRAALAAVKAAITQAK